MAPGENEFDTPALQCIIFSAAPATISHRLFFIFCHYPPCLSEDASSAWAGTLPGSSPVLFNMVCLGSALTQPVAQRGFPVIWTCVSGTIYANRLVNLGLVRIVSGMCSVRLLSGPGRKGLLTQD